MSIARLKKVSLCGLSKEKDLLLEELQALGCMHLVPLTPAPAEVEKQLSPRADAAYKALRFLTDAPRKRRQVQRDLDFDVDALCRDVLALKQETRDVSDRRDFLEHRIAAVEPWGDLHFPPKDSLAHYHLWFYSLPLHKLGALEKIDLPWQIVHKDHRLAHVIVIARDEPPDDLLPVPRTHTGALPLTELKAQLDEAEIALEELVARREALTRYIYLLSANLAEAENRASLAFADQQTREEAGIVAVQGWVPADAIAGVKALADQRNLACLLEEPAPEDKPPTLIEEAEELQAGVDLALFYTVPPYRGWDPSLVLFASFSIFFAMILSDAGYAAVLMLGLLAYWRRLGHSGKGRAYRLLGLSLFGCALVYGTLAGSYFGVSPPPGSLLDHLHIIDINDHQSMMQLSIMIGVLHIALGNGLTAYVNRRRLVALANIGWIIGLAGGTTIAFAQSDAELTRIGYGLLIAGLAMVFAFSSERPVSIRPKEILFRGLDGLKALTGVMGAFGDVLSYMRLFALGLASASLALTFNELAMQAQDALPGLGLLLAILILVCGHLINLGLAVMSGVVHGLRLNFIEFYKWGMPGEGEAFRKFARKEVQP